MPAAVNRFPAVGTLGCPPRLNISKKTKKTQEPAGEPILEPTDEPIHNPILAPPHLAGSTVGVSTLLDLPPGRSSSQDLRHRRRLGPSRRGSVSSPCGSTSWEQRVDATALDPPPCGSTSQGVDAAAWIRRRVDHSSLRATQLLAYEREMREVLRGERGWEREGERDTGHGGMQAWCSVSLRISSK